MMLQHETPFVNLLSNQVVLAMPAHQLAFLGSSILNVIQNCHFINLIREGITNRSLKMTSQNRGGFLFEQPTSQL